MGASGQPLTTWQLGLALALGLLLWVNAFGLELLPFWPAMILAALGTMALAVGTQGIPEDWRRVAWYHWPLGLLHGLVVYGVFWLGDLVTSSILPAQSDDLGALYGLVGGGTTWQALAFVGLAVLAEELFWRGLLQRQLALRLGVPQAIVLATICYSLAHLGARSLLLTLATLTAGLAWGSLYAHQRALLPALLSHLVFDLLAIFLFPFSGL
jgi:membrane protease YdiL (CAAX protease family)